MISNKTTETAMALLAAVNEAGLVDLVADNHAFQTLNRIVETGSSLSAGIEESEEVTEETAKIFSRPELWGWMTDRSRQGEWQDFVIEWYESLLNRGKTR